MTKIIKGLSNLTSNDFEKTNYITFEDKVPKVVLILDWGEEVGVSYQHYDKSWKPAYIRCTNNPSECPLCASGLRPQKKFVFRVYDPVDKDVKVVSMSQTATRNLVEDFEFDGIDPLTTYVTITRSGTGTQTSYRARQYRPNPANNMPEYPMPDKASLKMPDLDKLITPMERSEIERIIGVGGMDMVDLANVEVNEAPATPF